MHSEGVDAFICIYVCYIKYWVTAIVYEFKIKYWVTAIEYGCYIKYWATANINVFY